MLLANLINFIILIFLHLIKRLYLKIKTPRIITCKIKQIKKIKQTKQISLIINFNN
ncbi:hypothetical protein EBME_2112 [bacterium endosymbiont of Mortierella elongata FMR23-6]|nr:hypothetical protein EBME_2112 [bacterium endosymbiont of Mortierella elongata FMR23-6]